MDRHMISILYAIVMQLEVIIVIIFTVIFKFKIGSCNSKLHNYKKKKNKNKRTIMYMLQDIMACILHTVILEWLIQQCWSGLDM